MKRLFTGFLFALLLPVFFSAAVFAAPVRRVLATDFYEQGLQALTLDAEGASDFRYCGLENQLHTYRGIIKPGDKLKFTIKATIAPAKYIPLKKRSAELRLEVIAKKGQQVLKKDSYKKTNKSNLFLDYTVPDGTDTLEVYESFALLNDSNTPRYNVTRIDRSRFVLMTKDTAAAAGVTASGKLTTSGGSGGGKARPGKMAFVAAFLVAGVIYYLRRRKRDRAAGKEEPVTYQPRVCQAPRVEPIPDIRPPQREQEKPQPLKREDGEQRTGQPDLHAAGPAAFGTAVAVGTAAPQPPVTARFCTECGAKLPAGAAFCTECGTKCQ